MAPIELAITPALVIGGAAIFINFLYIRKQKFRPVPVRHMPHELLIRSAMSLIPLLVITGIARIIGPNYSGLLTIFPLIWSIVFSFTNAQGGRDAVVCFFRGAALGQFAYFAFFATLIIFPTNNLWLWFGGQLRPHS